MVFDGETRAGRERAFDDRRASGRSCVLVVLALALLVALPILGVVVVRLTDDRPTLRHELTEMRAMLDATLVAVADGRPVTLGPDNADLANADSPRNGLSRRPGYDECDSARDWVLPGWASFRSYDLRLRQRGLVGTQDKNDLLRATERFWAEQGFAVRTDRDDGYVRLSIDTDHWSISLDADGAEFEAHLSGSTDCLPLAQSKA